MMTIHERAKWLADASVPFYQYVGRPTAAGLLALVEAELGHVEILDDFRMRAGGLARAVAPKTILHIVSGNTPAAALQSLMRGILLGSHNLCKLPSGGLREAIAFRDELPRELASMIEFSQELPPEWLEDADAVIVFGRDETIEHFRAKIRPNQTFMAYGHKLSFGVVFEDPAHESVAGAARDVSVFDQQGCLSPHVFFVADNPLAYAAELAQAMERHQQREPRGPLSLSEANAIRGLREELAFRAANDEPVAVFQSSGSTAWTVAFYANPGFPRTPLNRFIFIKPMPADLRTAVAGLAPHLSTIGIWPPTLDNARRVSGLGATRICAVGRMQQPPLTWHQDGQPVLAPLVRWIDAEIMT